MIEKQDHEIPIRLESDIITVRKQVRTVATDLGFGLTDVTRIVTSASELARNIMSYAGAGVMRWFAIESEHRTGIELTFADNGPGIIDIEAASEPGYSSNGGLGMGLPGTKRLMDEMEIQSEVGEGTTVIIKKWLKK